MSQPKDIRPRLTKRMNRQYQSILRLDNCAWFHLPQNSILGSKITWGSIESLIHSLVCFASKYHSRQIDIRRMQKILIKSGAPIGALNFAMRVPGANIKKLERVVLKNGTPELMRIFAQKVPGANNKLLDDMANVIEIMQM